MKNSLLLSLLIMLSMYGQGQVAFRPCYYSVLDTNNILAGFQSNGDLFCKDTINPQLADSFDVYQVFRVPKTGAASSVFSGSVWVAGKSNGQLYNSSAEYQNNYQPGPANLLSQDSVTWDYIWTILRSDVLSVKTDFDSNHAITHPVPASVLTWPAKGNPTAAGRGGALLNITQDMAPFVDRNGDGVYNVYDGDYPLVRGDEMIWFINSDRTSLSQNPMGIDRRYSIYQYNSSTDSNLNNTLFLSVSIKNQSGRSYDSVSIASFVDFDLGCANNDRTGSIPSKNTFFVYNGYVQGATQQNGITCDEGSVCPVGEVGYGCSLPIMSATFLNDSMKVYCYYTNGVATGQSDPSTDQSFYRYMNGQWNDGTPLTFGGTGYNGTTAYPFAFPGNPADGSQWSECNPQIGPAIAAGDRRSVGAIGPFALAAGDTISFDMAFIFHPGPYDNCPDISDSGSVVQHVDSISRYYASERFTQWYDSTKSLAPAFTNVGIASIPTGPVFSIVPNPNKGSFNIHVSSPGMSEYSISVTDMLGRLVYYNSNAQAPDQSVRMADASSGVYTVTLEAQNFKSTKKITISK